MFSVEEWRLADRFRADKQNGRADIREIWNWVLSPQVLQFPLWYRLCKRIPLIWPSPPPPLSVQRRVLILDLNGLLFKEFDEKYGEQLPYWPEMRHVVEGGKQFWVRPDAEVFLNFCFRWFEVWIWSCSRFEKLKRSLATVFPDHHKRFNRVVSQAQCTRAPFTMGGTDKPVFHKDLKKFPDLPPDTLIFDDSAYKLMFNSLGSFLVFPKLEKQSKEERACFLSSTVINWLAHWLISKDRIEYTKRTVICKDGQPDDAYVRHYYWKWRIEYFQNKGRDFFCKTKAS